MNVAIQSYIKQAKRKRATLTQTSNSKKKSAVEVDSTEQLMLPIGRMYHCLKRGRGVLIRGIPPNNINFNISSTYQHMLDRCKSNLNYTEDEKQKCEFYLADAKGVPIWTDDSISVDEASGEKHVPWTLSNYITHSNIKYASKAKFYCVIKESKCEDTDEDVAEEVAEDAGLQENEDTPNVTPDESSAIDLRFTPLFVKAVKSRYREQYSFLTTPGEDFNDGKIPKINPCHEGSAFAGIRFPNAPEMYLISDLKCSSGTVEYKTPHEDSKWGIWSDWELGSSTNDNIVMMAAVITGGYHGTGSYQWSRNSDDLEDEVYPLIIVTSTGRYSCTCTIDCSKTVTVKVVFEIKEGDGEKWVVEAPPPNSSTAMSGVVAGEIDSAIAVNRLKNFLKVSNDPSQLNLLEMLGQGSFGTVHKASWRGSLVAAKVIPMSPKDVRAIEREVDILKKLNHPNLSCCLGVEKKPGSVTIISPLVIGHNLQDLIFDDETKSLQICEKMFIIVQLCQALTFLHTSHPPFAHLDVKPANIMVDTLTFHVTLTDFGLARFMSQTSAVGTKTMLAGSPGYQSPEQLRGETIGPASDVYGYGAVVYVTITNANIWPGLSHFQIMQKVTSNETPNTDSLPTSFKDLCRQCFLPLACRPLITDVLIQLKKIISKE